MKKFIFFVCTVFFISGLKSQFLSLTGYFAKDFASKRNYMEVMGAEIGIGVEDIYLGKSPFILSTNIGVTVFDKPDPYIKDDIFFDLPSEFDNRGFGTISPSKKGFVAQVHLGFDPLDYYYLQPYISLGYELNKYRYSLKYDLYERPPELEINDESYQLHYFSTRGFQTGIGLKFRPFPDSYGNLLVDFRFIYSGAWVHSNFDKGLAVQDSFYIDHYGNEQMSYQSNRYMHNFGFRAGLIFDLGDIMWVLMSGAGSGDYDSSSGSDSNYYYDNDSSGSSSGSSDSNSSGSSGSSGGSTTLTPLPSRGGGR